MLKHTQAILIFFLLFFLPSCHAQPQTEEERYKEAAGNLFEVLDDIRLPRQKVKTTEFPNGEIVEYWDVDRERRKELIEKNHDKFVVNYNDLSNIAAEGQKSNWSDDAAFCKALGYLYVISGSKEMFSFKGNALEEVLNDFDSFSIEDWTIKESGMYYDAFFQMIPAGLKTTLPASDVLKGGLYGLLVIEYYNDGNIEKAKLEVEKMKENHINQYFIDSMKKMMDAYERTLQGGG